MAHPGGLWHRVRVGGEVGGRVGWGTWAQHSHCSSLCTGALPHPVVEPVLTSVQSRFGDGAKYLAAMAQMVGQGTDAAPLTLLAIRSMGGVNSAADKPTALSAYWDSLVAQDPSLAKPATSLVTDAQYKATELLVLESVYETAVDAVKSMQEGKLNPAGEAAVFDEARTEHARQQFVHYHGYVPNPELLAKEKTCAVLFKLFVVGGIYPCEQDTTLQKMHAQGIGNSFEAADEGVTNFVTTDSGAGGVVLTSHNTAYKNRPLSTTAQLFNAVAIKFTTLAFVAIGIQAPAHLNGQEYGLVRGVAMYCAYPEVLNLLAVLTKFAGAPFSGAKPLIQAMETLMTAMMRPPASKTPSACIHDAAIQLMQGLTLVQATASLLGPAGKFLAASGGPVQQQGGSAPSGSSGTAASSPRKRKQTRQPASPAGTSNSPLSQEQPHRAAKAKYAPTTEGAGTTGPGGFERMIGGNPSNPKKCGTPTCGATHACSFSHADK